MKRFLPLGSIIKFKNRLFMISGYDMETEDNKKFEYSCIFYPEGLTTDSASYGINESDIDKIVFLGYVNAEAQAYWMKKISDKE